MKSLTTLVAILAAITTSYEQGLTRDRWNMMYSPEKGYLGIRHRSQKKQRLIERRRGVH